MDVQASSNPAGLVRLPGSFNTATHDYGHFNFLHADSIDLYEAAKSIRESHSLCSEKKKTRPDDDKSNDPLKAAKSRESKLAKLVEIRHDADPDGPENRDLILLYVYNAFLTATDNSTVAMQHALDFNQRFYHPLSEHDIKIYMGTSRRIGGYKFKNETIMAALDMTAKECDDIGFGIHGRVISEEERQQHRQNKQKRNAIILKCVEEGRNAGYNTEEDIAKAAGCSPATVMRVLKAHKLATPKQNLHNQILKDLKDGVSFKHIMKKYGDLMSRSGLRYIQDVAWQWRIDQDNRKQQREMAKRVQQWMCWNSDEEQTGKGKRKQSQNNTIDHLRIFDADFDLHFDLQNLGKFPDIVGWMKPFSNPPADVSEAS